MNMKNMKIISIAALILLLLLALPNFAPIATSSTSTGSNQPITRYGTGQFQSVGSSASFQIDQSFSSEVGPNDASQINRLHPFSGQQSVRTDANHVPAFPGLPFASSNPGFTGFNGLTHRDQRLAGTGEYANTQFTAEPPDQGLCVSSSYVLEAVNNALVVYDISGNLLTSPTALNQFFSLQPQIIRSSPPVFGNFTSDPKCYFDSSTSRWFLTELEIDLNSSTGAFVPRSHQLIAVSQTGDPTGKWYLFSFDTTDDGQNGTPSNPGCPCFGDQPLIGADANGFYVSTNEAPDSEVGLVRAQIYAMSKAGLESGSITSLVHLSAGTYNLPNEVGTTYSLQPATVPPGGAFAPNTEFFLGSLQLATLTDTQIALWALTGTSSLGSASPSLSLSLAVVHTELYGGTAAGSTNALQENGSTPLGSSFRPAAPLEFLATDDDRMNQVVYADGMLFSGVNTVVKTANGPAVNGIAYFIVTPSQSGGVLSGTIANQGYVAVNGAYVMFPAIGVNAAGEGVMTFTLSGTNFFPTAAYVTINASKGVGPVHIAAGGVLPDDGLTGYYVFGSTDRTARWGDYSAAVAGPDGRIWFATEYIPGLPRTLFANWGTFIGVVVP